VSIFFRYFFAMSATPDSPVSETKKITKLCALHGKKRQPAFLILSAEGEWVCREEDLCKMSHTPSSLSLRVKGPKFEEITDVTVAELSGRSSLTSAEPLMSRSLADLNAPNGPSIMSWADEVDQEYPEGYIAADDDKVSPTEPSPPDGARWPSSFPMQRASLPKVKKFGEKVRQYNEAELLNRIEQLQDEVSCTKRELRKARDEMKSVMKNEKLLETIVQELREEVEEIRKKQLQLDVPGHDEPVRKSFGTAKLNPDATPFIPVQCQRYDMRHEEAGNIETGRSTGHAPSSVTTTPILEMESCESDAGITHDEGTAWSEQEDDQRATQPRMLRSRSQETYNRSSSMCFLGF
jgi:hypothetical protein